MRDDEPFEAQDSSACNVVVLGDSVTFGIGVDGEETYPNVLETLLMTSAAENPIQVLNLGVGGYSSQDEALVLKHRFLSRICG